MNADESGLLHVNNAALALNYQIPAPYVFVCFKPKIDFWLKEFPKTKI